MDSCYIHGSEELHELTAPAEDAVGHDLDVFLIKRNTQLPTHKTELSSVCISNMSSSKSIFFKEVRESRGVHAVRLLKSCHVTQCSPQLHAISLVYSKHLRRTTPGSLRYGTSP